MWSEWSARALAAAVRRGPVLVNPMVFAEVSVGFSRMEDLDDARPPDIFRREPLPYVAAFLAGKAFLAYLRRGGSKTLPLPDFFIGAHAAVAHVALLTRDARRFRTYFPTVRLSAPRAEPLVVAPLRP